MLQTRDKLEEHIFKYPSNVRFLRFLSDLIFIQMYLPIIFSFLIFNENG